MFVEIKFSRCRRSLANPGTRARIQAGHMMPPAELSVVGRTEIFVIANIEEEFKR